MTVRVWVRRRLQVGGVRRADLKTDPSFDFTEVTS
jgi:hypothetical protein